MAVTALPDSCRLALVVMTVQDGQEPECVVADGKASVGKQEISFDGKRILLSRFDEEPMS